MERFWGGLECAFDLERAVVGPAGVGRVAEQAAEVAVRGAAGVGRVAEQAAEVGGLDEGGFEMGAGAVRGGAENWKGKVKEGMGIGGGLN